MRKIKDEYLRSFLFGFEDALVSTTGMVVGISIGTTNLKFILLAAFVTISVFISYVIGGLIPVIPIILLGHTQGIIGSIIAAFIGLFILGFVKGKIVQVNRLRSAFQMLIIGGIAAIIGVIVGLILRV